MILYIIYYLLAGVLVTSYLIEKLFEDSHDYIQNSKEFYENLPLFVHVMVWVILSPFWPLQLVMALHIWSKR